MLFEPQFKSVKISAAGTGFFNRKLRCVYFNTKRAKHAWFPYKCAESQCATKLELCCEWLILRNFNSPDHGSNLQRIKHQAKRNLIKSVVTGEPTMLLRRRSNCKLGSTKSKMFATHFNNVHICCFK